MYIDVLYRIRASPLAHLGCRSLTRLDAFQVGYGLFPQITKAKDYSLDAFRDWVLARYLPMDGTTMDAAHVLLAITQDDERAFDLFFAALDAAIAGHPDGLILRAPALKEGEPLPVSGYLDVLTERPAMFLRRVTLGCLRAFLDGYSLAAMEEGHPECVDLDGFEYWVRRQFDLRGYFRWENAVLLQFNGDEVAAFQWAVRELKAYRASKGPVSPRHYEVVLIRDPG
jgi:hypothetical protein